MSAKTRLRTPTPANCRLCVLAPLAIALLVPQCGAWAFAPEMLPSMAIWTNFMQKIHEPKSTPISEEDTDGDGVVDVRAFRHADGVYIDVSMKPGPEGMITDTVILREDLKDKFSWVFGFDKSGDGVIDMLVRGWFAENKWAQMLYDSDQDGRPDRFQLDMDQNGVYDFMGVDVDGDGRLDFLYDLDNKTGEVLNETVGWVTFKEQQREEALPLLYYSFEPVLKTLSGQEPIVVSARWDYGDGAIRSADALIPGEHVYQKPGTFEVNLDVKFKMPGGDRVYKAWYGVSLPVEAPPPGPPPLNAERVRAVINPFFGACGFITANERPKEGAIAELWPEVTLPADAPQGNAMQAGAVAAGDLDLTAYWWRSDAEATAFIDAVLAAQPKPALPGLEAMGDAGQPFELATKVRARMVDKSGRRIATFRQDGFVFVLTTNRTAQELQRWTRLLHDILNPPVAAPKPTE